MKSLIPFLFVSLLAMVNAGNFQVMVGSGGLTYSPNTVEAPVGSTVEFIFVGTNDVTEAAFSSPCNYLSGGAYSGVSPQPNFVITVTDTSPRFFYCSVGSHCQAGMVFALNPSSSETFAAFQSAAEKVGSSGISPPSSAVGGFSGAISSSPSTNTAGSTYSTDEVTSYAIANVSSNSTVALIVSTTILQSSTSYINATVALRTTRSTSSIAADSPYPPPFTSSASSCSASAMASAMFVVFMFFLSH